MSSLSSKQGPRYRHAEGESAPYETIGVDKLTPIIGAEIGGVDLARPLSNRAARRDPPRAGREPGHLLSRPAASRRSSTWLRPAVRRAARPSRGAARARPSRADDHLRRRGSQRANGEGWHSDVSCDEEPPMGSILYIKQCPPHGGDTLFASMYAAYEALSDRMKAYLDGPHRDARRRARLSRALRQHRRRRQADLPERRASGGAHPSGDRQEGALRQPRLHPRLIGMPRDESDALLATSTSTRRTRCSSAASAGPRTRSRSGTTAAPSTARCGTTGRTRRSGNRVTVKGERPV